VVANEVKDLAKQTSDATMQIANQIQEIQNQTQDVVLNIKKNTDFNNKVNQITLTIAEAVAEQTNTTTEVSKIMDKTANAAEKTTSAIQKLDKDIEHKILESVQKTLEKVENISTNIQGLNEVAGGTTQSAKEIQNVGLKLAELVERSKDELAKFNL
jgi:methyl-accepting chemotaxis protein